MAKPENSKTVSPTPVVEDPHPGSISDGTHPAAKEHKQPKARKGTGADNNIPGSADKPHLEEGQTAVNSKHRSTRTKLHKDREGESHE